MDEPDEEVWYKDMTTLAEFISYLTMLEIVIGSHKEWNKYSDDYRKILAPIFQSWISLKHKIAKLITYDMADRYYMEHLYHKYPRAKKLKDTDPKKYRKRLKSDYHPDVIFLNEENLNEYLNRFPELDKEKAANLLNEFEHRIDKQLVKFKKQIGKGNEDLGEKIYAKMSESVDKLLRRD